MNNLGIRKPFWLITLLTLLLIVGAQKVYDDITLVALKQQSSL